MGVHSSQSVYAEVKKLLGIPEDEPIFILRAQDRFSAGAITAYRATVMPLATSEWDARVNADITEFRNWQRINVERVKVPD